MVHDTLFIIPARGGSKGIPGKNIRLFAGKPLLAYSIDLARAFVPDDNICLSTDSIDIARVATQMGLPVPFRRPLLPTSPQAAMSYYMPCRITKLWESILNASCCFNPPHRSGNPFI